MTTHDPADLLAAAAPRLSAEAKARHLQLLAVEQAATPTPPTPIVGRRRRRGWITATAGIAVLVVGAGTAAAWVGRAEPTVRDTARCFAIATTEFDDFDASDGAFFDVTYLSDPVPGVEGNPSDQTAEHALEVCAHTWRIGGIAASKPYHRDLDPWYVDFDGPQPPTYPVPELVACVLPAGQVGVFPDTDCAALGLPEGDLG
ncbi:MAG: hypothetical protein MUF09_09285 [Candidatus Nanopelagicales bacterium]|jgi:hypothetical protein|nr:hypothetical protein [Candidatus Nanopelagicales bacterium]